MITKTCEQCGEPFEVKPYREEVAKYCSYECYWEAMKGIVPNHTPRRRVTLTCVQCGNEFEAKEYRKDEAKYCSVECFYEGAKGRAPWNKEKKLSEEHRANLSKSHLGQQPWNKKEKVKLICKMCHEEFEVNESRRETANFCSYRCNGAYNLMRVLGRYQKPNKLEGKFIHIVEKHGLPYKYVGNGEVIIGGKCPDFINVNGKKEVVEIFGSYWHNPMLNPEISEHRTHEGTIEHYKKYGFKCSVLWDTDLENEEKVLEVIDHCR